jgi:hypothetical protein
MEVLEVNSLIFIVGGPILWMLFGWFGYGMTNEIRYGQWTVPRIKKDRDLWWFKVCVFGGLATCVMAGLILLLQAIDTMENG